MNITPLKGTVVIRPDEVKTKTESGLLIKEQWDTRPPTGIIVSIADDITEVKVGDHVIFMRYGSIATPDKELRLIQASHLLGIING